MRERQNGEDDEETKHEMSVANECVLFAVYAYKFYQSVSR
jgi:hypothetical protein